MCLLEKNYSILENFPITSWYPKFQNAQQQYLPLNNNSKRRKKGK